MQDNTLTIAIIGGSGALGGGLAFQWARAGYSILIGSRTSAKGEAAAAALITRLPSAKVAGMSNSDAAKQAEIIVLTVPFSHHDSTVEEIRGYTDGKIVVDTTVPLVPPKVSRVQISDDWPIAKKTQQMLGENVRVVSAFQNVAAAHLQQADIHAEGDVLVCGNNLAAREIIIELVGAAGLRGWHAGAIDNSVVSEALTSVLIFINKKYNIDGAGIRITGLSNPVNE
jgi:NADPH-dependent F420 reductase